MPAEPSGRIGKRKRGSPSSGLAPGVELKRTPANSTRAWDLVLEQVKSTEDITNYHRKLVCGLSTHGRPTLCSNKFSPPAPRTEAQDSDDIIVISDDDDPGCRKKTCEKHNPYCLNYLGQEKWDKEEDAMNLFVKRLKLGADPHTLSRKVAIPVGLKNLGATCYANSCLQVWFRDLAFRKGVYQCLIPHNENLKDHPIYQLQMTFGALQESACKVFNPVKLVESLRIPQDTQQDAQEFAKLFMTLLDREFQRQSIPSVRSLVRDRFQGRQVYGTRCNTCETESERDSDFLEIEITLQNNAKLEDCLTKSLEPEMLTDDNQYFCSVCQSKQDATRYSKYRSLPPALHFSLQRFTYDFNAMTRKKSKDTILVPKTIDMGPFISTHDVSNIYDLQAVLLHKGTSCYHGHYEAQVFDHDQQSWFLFNDENVTPITRIGNQKVGKGIGKNSSGAVSKGNPRKKAKTQRIEDSDDEASKEVKPGTTTEYVSSKEAYMVVYSRREHLDPHEQDPNPLDLPSQVKDAMSSMNAGHATANKDYASKLALARAALTSLRRHVMDIYQSWAATSEDNAMVVSRQALQRWLEEGSIAAAAEKFKQSLVPDDTSESTPDSLPVILNFADDIMCEDHQLLKPELAADMKFITKDAFTRIREQTNCQFYPEVTAEDVCPLCVETEFTERLYQQEHPRLVENLENIIKSSTDDGGIWISKQWLKDWQLKRPKMHTIGQDDPPPDGPAYRDHVECSHGHLNVATIHRKRICYEAYRSLKKIFPSWSSFGTDSGVCPICDVEQHTSLEERRLNRTNAEHEKNRLPFMREKNAGALENIPLALIPAHFLDTWRRWITRPTEAQRPLPFTTEAFLCPHNMLSIDPNASSDLGNVAAVIRQEDFQILADEFYLGSGPLIPLTRIVVNDGVLQYLHDMDVCLDCRSTRKTSWSTTEIVIRTAGSQSSNTSLVQNGTSGSRQSRRLRRMKECRVVVTKETLVKDIKFKVQDILSIPIIHQTLILRGRELTDGSECVGRQFFVGEVLELKEEKEVVDLVDSDEDKPAAEENAFGGTLLSSA